MVMLTGKLFPAKAAQIRADLFAGITIGFLLIPQSMAYAELAGMPAYYGLYSAFIPVIIGGLFGHLPELGQGPTAMTSILTASVLGSVAAPGTPDYIRLAFVLAFCVGIIRLIVGLLKFASITNIISYPVISGFINAGALIIILKQLPRLFGIEIIRQNGLLGSLSEVWQFITGLGRTVPPVLVMALLSAAVILILRKLLPKIPSVLIVLVLSIAISCLIGYHKNLGGDVVGAIPGGLPSFMFLGRQHLSLPGIWKDIVLVFPGSLLVALISMMEVLSVSQTVCYETDQKMNLDQELTGQGLAALIGSFFQAFPTGGSFSRTALNLHTKPKSRLNILVSGLFVMLVLLVLTPLLHYLPLSVLAAIIAISAIRLINPRKILGSFEISTQDGIISLLTFTSTLVFAPAIHKGILTGIAMSLLLYISGKMKPRTAVLGKHKDGSLREHSIHSVEKHPFIIVLRFDASLNFLTAKAFEQAVIDIVAEHRDYRAFLLIADGINSIDTTGLHSLKQAIIEIRKDDIDLNICGIKTDMFRILEKTGTLDSIGRDHIFHDQQEAVKDIESRLT